MENSEYDSTVNRQRMMKLGRLKQQLRRVMCPAAQVGRGYLVDACRFDAIAVADLMDEYNTVAWGRTHWARNASLEADEARVMRQFVHDAGEHALEVGAGAGRVTSHLLRHFGHVTATDRCEAIVSNLRLLLQESPNLNLVVDDITCSALPDASFDSVSFWENGLGSLLSFQQRQQAMLEMTRLLKPGGVLVLALRQLPQSPVDHLMPASQNADYMGIYHTFTPDEVLALSPPQLHHVAMVQGNERPAGGRAFFMVYRKICA